MKNDYATAIHLLTSETLDFKDIAIQLAMKHPSLFVRFASSKEVLTDAGLAARYNVSKKVIDYLKAGLFIHSIKQIRDDSGASLKEAKDKAEAVRDALRTMGYSCEDGR